MKKINLNCPLINRNGILIETMFYCLRLDSIVFCNPHLRVFHIILYPQNDLKSFHYKVTLDTKPNVSLIFSRIYN